MAKVKKALGATGEFFRRRDAWRSHPMLNNQFRHATPGLGIALVAFGLYVAGEFAYNNIYANTNTNTTAAATSASLTDD